MLLLWLVSLGTVVRTPSSLLYADGIRITRREPKYTPTYEESSLVFVYETPQYAFA